MDIISHGLWAGAVLGRRSRKEFWWSFALGMAPDLLSFGVFTGMMILGLASSPDWSAGPPPDGAIPPYVHLLYNITHSLVVFALAFFAVWLIRRKPFLPLLAWGLHIGIDIPTHSTEFFPTPFLWPFFDNIRVDGISWGHPVIFIPNVILLIVVYLWFFRAKNKTSRG